MQPSTQEIPSDTKEKHWNFASVYRCSSLDKFFSLKLLEKKNEANHGC